ncbi:MAG: hypothetical protein ABI947_04710 [Chloroflexota bacterium]
MIIELKGHIGEDGKIVLHTQTALPSGEVDIVIAYADNAEGQDEALWDAQFAATPISAFEALIDEALADYRDEQTEPFDPTSSTDNSHQTAMRLKYL